MINMLLSQTLEVDDPDLAVKEILSQLKLDQNLEKNALGFIHCNDAFIGSGVVKAVTEALPFRVVGMNTLLHSSSLGLIDNMLFNLSVLTSSDVSFATGLSEPMGETDLKDNLTETYKRTLTDTVSRPSLALLYCPPTTGRALGEDLVRNFDSISDKVPLYGALAADYSTDIRNPRVIYDGAAYKDRFLFVLLEGSVKPRFFSFPVSHKKIIRQKAIVTESDGHVLKKVNGMPVLEFLETLGLCRNGQIIGPHTIPLILDRHDGHPPLARIIHHRTPEGHILLGGNAPVDTTIGIGALDVKHIEEGVKRISSMVKLKSPDVFWLYSCVSRNFALGLNYTAEAEALHTELGGKIPYLFAYSCGEICPVLLKDGKWHNEYHNMSLIAMIF
jgi:hypothetical protein